MAEKKKQVQAASFYGDAAILGTIQADTIAVGETLTLASLTTTQRNALSAVNGMIVYNTTDAKIQGYQAGSWQNLI